MVFVLTLKVKVITRCVITFHIRWNDIKKKEYQMKFKFLNTALVGMVLSISSFVNVANATLIEFTDGIKTLQSCAVCAGDCNNVQTYEEDGYLFEFFSQDSYIDAFIGNYDGSGEDVMHGHNPNLNKVMITRIDNALFNLDNFQLTTNVDWDGLDLWDINALVDGINISDTFFLPIEESVS